MPIVASQDTSRAITDVLDQSISWGNTVSISMVVLLIGVAVVTYVFK